MFVICLMLAVSRADGFTSVAAAVVTAFMLCLCGW